MYVTCVVEIRRCASRAVPPTGRRSYAGGDPARGGRGGGSVALARDQGARVIGADIDAGVLERAQALVDETGLSGTLSLESVEPGPQVLHGAEK